MIHGGVGAVNESDVSLAATSNAIIIGFNVRPDAMAKQLADQEGVDLRLYKVIYQAIEDVEAAMKGMLDPVYEGKSYRPCRGSSAVQSIRRWYDCRKLYSGWYLPEKLQGTYYT